MKGHKTLLSLQAMKGKEGISCLTAYDFITATLLDQAGCDLLLVGDSLGNVVLGYDNTLGVTMTDMIRHTQAVARAAKQSMVIADLPFLSYQTSTTDAIRNAGTLLQSGAHGVKLEGGVKVAPTVTALVDTGIPVMGHIGLTPQSIHGEGGYRTYGKTSEEAQRLMTDAIALEKAGAFAIVLECVTPAIATEITRSIAIPTIGIGSGPSCDGQILVTNDLLGLFVNPPPSFVKPKANFSALIKEAVGQYIAEVKHGK